MSAGADTLPASADSAQIELFWATPLVPDDSEDSLPIESSAVFGAELFAAGNESPGLEFSLSPTDEEIFLGWRFAF